jgi:hypothetical protein
MRCPIIQRSLFLYLTWNISSAIGYDQWLIVVGSNDGPRLPPGGTYSIPSAMRSVMMLELRNCRRCQILMVEMAILIHTAERPNMRLKKME